jgi:hypothetical protein
MTSRYHSLAEEKTKDAGQEKHSRCQLKFITGHFIWVERFKYKAIFE